VVDVSWWKIWQRGTSERELVVPEILPARPPVVPRPPPAPDPEPSTSKGLGGAPVADRPHVFDPALKHFSSGLLPEEPKFATPEELAAWRALQRHVMSHVLSCIADSPAAQHLVLRGSALLCAWFPETARPPKDLDFVVVPDTLSIKDPRASELLESVVVAVTGRECEGVELRRDEVAQDDIWTYDRVPGTRLVFRWTVPGMPWGATQLDFVFGERLPMAYQVANVTLAPGRHARLQIAPRELSLAWKLLWLHSDLHPRGKDLYDAMLLAEDTPLPWPLVEAVFEIAGNRPPLQADAARVGGERDWVQDFEWVGFEAHDPLTVEAWRRRLARALAKDTSGES
jgi:hypothetical protein